MSQPKGAQQPVACGWWAEHCSRMAAASSCSRSVGHCHGIAPSGQAAGGSGDSYFGQPKAPQLSWSLQHRAYAGAGTWVLSWAALGEVHTLPMRSPAPRCSPTPRGEPHPRDEAAQCGSDMGDAEPIQTALCLPASCNQGRGRNNSLGTCSQNMSSQQWSLCLCPGLSPPATCVHSGKHKPCAASWAPCVPPRRAAGRAAWGSARAQLHPPWTLAPGRCRFAHPSCCPSEPGLPPGWLDPL